MRPVCYCNEEKAQCETCGKGYAQELAAGRTPKFIPKVEPKPIQSPFANSCFSQVLFKCSFHWGVTPLGCVFDYIDGRFKFKQVLCRFCCAFPCCLKVNFQHMSKTNIHFNSPLVPTFPPPRKQTWDLFWFAQGAPPTEPMKEKKVPVCGCGEQRDTCGTCKAGYLEMTLQGRPCHFKTIMVRVRRAPVCGCGLERAECGDCNKGYLTVTTSGLTPEFRDFELNDGDDPKSGKGEKGDETGHYMSFSSGGQC